MSALSRADACVLVEDYLDIAARTRWTLTTYLGRVHGRSTANPRSALRRAAEKELERRHDAGQIIAIDSAVAVGRPAYIRADVVPF